jgi:outer membrane immunogenic protein
MKNIIIAAVLSASLSGAAFAQDKTPFSGPYVGGIVGYDHTRLAPLGNDNGILYGGVAGYDLNLNGLVLGVEGEFSDSNVKESVTDVLVLGDRTSVKAGRDIYGGIRIGGSITDNVMLYAKGGYTNAKAKAAYDDGVDIIRGSQNLDGYRLGAGLETTLNGFTVRGEYRYSSYEHVAGVKPERQQVALIAGYRF